MLNLFRQKGVMSFIYTLLMGAVIVVFVVQFRPNADSPVSGFSRKCVAKIRGTCIDEREWRAQRYLLRGQYDASGVNWNKAAVDSLIERTLLEQEAKRLGIRVTEDDVMNEIVRWRVHVTVPAAMRPQARNLGIDPSGVRWTQFGTKEKPFDQSVFEKVVQSTTGQNTTEFIDAQAQELVAARMLLLVAQRVKVGDNEAFDQFVIERSTTTLKWIKLDDAFFAEHFVGADKAAIEKWAGEHKKEVDDAIAKLPKDAGPNRLYDAKQILIESKKDDPADKRADAKKKADDLAAKIKKGEDFAKLAKDNSADTASKDKGGRLEWATLSEDPVLRDALAKAKPGDTVVIETPKGFHVAQLTAMLEGSAAVAFPLYRAARAEELAEDVGKKLEAALKGKLPVQIDAALKAKVEDAKKAGKSEADATTQVTADETKARIERAVEDVLAALPSTPWQTDDKRPRLEAGAPFNVSGAPIPGADDPSAISAAADKLSKDTPVIGPVKSGKDRFVLIYSDKHTATREEFDKDKVVYTGMMLAKKREDAVVNYLTALREGLNKETLTIDQKYVTAENAKGAPGEAPPPAQAPFEE
jgi:peptidyl-prolyl cis-trans isomerase D